MREKRIVFDKKPVEHRIEPEKDRDGGKRILQ